MGNVNSGLSTVHTHGVGHGELDEEVGGGVALSESEGCSLGVVWRRVEVVIRCQWPWRRLPSAHMRSRVSVGSGIVIVVFL